MKNNLQPITNNPQPIFGFTLVELLVVMGVIATVLAVVFPNFMGARQRARDARRKKNLTDLQNAIELYKLDQSPQSYPADGFMDSLCDECWSSGADCSGNIYLHKLPCDPQGPTPYIYTRNATDNLRYTLSACLENAADPDKDASAVTGCEDTATSYTINEP